jgi:Tol biopolymer transport system component
MHGLVEIDVETGDARALVDAPKVGLSGRYLADGRVSFEARRAGATRTLALDAKGVAEEIEAAEQIAFAHRDRIYVRSASGLVAVGTGDQFFAPVVSPDNSKLAFTGLATGIHVYDLRTGVHKHVGPGTAPTWSPDSEALVYERTEDDGHDIIGSDLWLWSQDAGARNFSQSETAIERRPVWSPDGKRIAFDDDQGSIYVVSAEVAK